MPRFNLGAYMNKRKELKEKTVNANKAIEEANIHLKEVERGLEVKKRELDAKVHKERRLHEKADIRTPTDMKEGKLTLSSATARRRRNELYQSAKAIHGRPKRSRDIGIADTLVHKCNVNTINNVFSSNSRFTKQVVPSLYKPKLINYEKSESNMLRSVATYYSGGVMGKQKYRSVYKSSGYAKDKRIKVNDCPIPRLVPYHKLMPFIKNIDIGKLHSVRETLCDGLEEDKKVNGVYRSLKELLLTLAKFYLQQHEHFKLIWFNGQTNTFFVSLGGDGAPFGKDDVATSWLVSFLNVGRGVLSSNENFLLFGANCTETAIPVQRFIKALVNEIKEIEESSYTVPINKSHITVKFHFAEIPNDMKMLAFLAGELPNSAKYFSSFANVNYDDLKITSSSFSYGSSSTWSPWNYQQRLEVAKEVADLKKTISRNKLTPSTLRSKVTKFIANKKSRQEFPPLIGKLVDRAHIEPLHLKNNACALAHRLLLAEVLYMSDLPQTVKYSEVPSHSPLIKYVTTMRTSCNLGRLAKKIVRWFDETRSASSKNMDYRFTGKDSKMFLHNFNVLISSVLTSAMAGQRQRIILHIISYMCLCLRDCVSLFNRLELTQDQVSKLKTLCHHYFCLHVMFLDSVNPTVWHIGHVVPIHTEDMLGKYGMGLALNSMEGREAKHISISSYSKNTIFKCRWEQVFLHEYVSLIWLRERGYNLNKSKSQSASYIPKCTEDPAYCHCGLQKDDDGTCQICNHRYRETIKLSISSGKSLFGEVKIRTV